MPKSGGSKALITGCFVISTLVAKLTESTQTNWYNYQSENPKESVREALKAWLEKEGSAPTMHRQAPLAARYHARPVKQPTISRRAENFSIRAGDRMALVKCPA